jgi:hypothetical protein
MKPKEIRQKILEAAYEHRHDDFGIETDELERKLPNVDEKTLHQEISYLEQKNWVNIKGKFMGKQYLNFSAVAITAWGVDLVEDPEEFGRVFSINLHQNNFGDITGSNISINSQYVSQLIQKQDDTTQKLLEDLIRAADNKDKSTILKTLGYIGDKSLDLLIAIIAGGVKL